MRVAPIKRYGGPGYPTRGIVDEHPELLRLVPKRWHGNPAVIAALTGVSVLISGCRGNSAQVRVPLVAPIFVHGEGRGSFGCKAVNPPVFLSEAEARQVIVEEAKRAGVNLSGSGPVLEKATVPVTSQYPWAEDFDSKGNYTPKKRTQKVALKLDGADHKRAISYEFVSSSDHDTWDPKGGKERRSTVWSYDIKGAADILREGLERTRAGGTLAVFYDPCAGPFDVQKVKHYTPPYGDPNIDWAKERTKQDAMAKDIARERLRKQVQDFVKWLKGQGVI